MLNRLNDFARLLYHKKKKSCYIWEVSSHPLPEFDPSIEHYHSGALPDKATECLLEKRMGKMNWWMTKRNIRSGKIDLLVMKHGERLSATGMVRSWKLHRRALSWLGKSGAVLGPYWTHPEDRGQGLYGRLLSASIILTARKEYERAYIFANVDNLASRRGIEKAGFMFLGCFDVSSSFMGLLHIYKPC